MSEEVAITEKHRLVSCLRIDVSHKIGTGRGGSQIVGESGRAIGRACDGSRQGCARQSRSGGRAVACVANGNLSIDAEVVAYFVTLSGFGDGDLATERAIRGGFCFVADLGGFQTVVHARQVNQVVGAAILKATSALSLVTNTDGDDLGDSTTEHDSHHVVERAGLEQGVNQGVREEFVDGIRLCATCALSDHTDNRVGDKRHLCPACALDYLLVGAWLRCQSPVDLNKSSHLLDSFL